MTLRKVMLRYLRKRRKEVTLRKDPDVRRFLSINRAFWRQHGAFTVQGRRAIIVEGAYGTDYPSLARSITAAIVAGAYEAQVIYLFDESPPATGAKYAIQRSFSRCRFESVPGLTHDRQEVIKSEAQAIFDALHAPEDVLGITYRGLPIGEQVYDGVLKRKHSSLWRLDDRVLDKIRHALATAQAIQTLCERYEVCAGLYSHVSCEGPGVAARALLQRSIPVFLGRGGLAALKRYNHMKDERGRLSPHLYVPKSWIGALSEARKTDLMQQAEIYIAERMAGKNINRVGLDIYAAENTFYASAEGFCRAYGLDPAKPCVFIMLHVMNDDPHCEEQHIFNDYYDWFVRTLDVVKDVSDVNWVFKQHPIYRRYHEDDADVRSVIEAAGRPHLAYLDENESFHSASLPNVAHALVTCGGTAGLEYTTQGVPAIMGSKSFYGGYGVCAEPPTFEAYAALLRDIRHLPRPTPAQVATAKLLFYVAVGGATSGFRYRDGILPDVTDFDVKQHSPSERLRGVTDVLSGPRCAAVSRSVEAMQEFIHATEGSTNVEDLYLKL